MNEPETSDDDFEIEIYSPSGHGARVPYSKGRKYLQENFGIDLDEVEKPGGDATDANGAPGAIADPPGNTGGTRPTQKYFGGKPKQQ
jgi:hypothetical protein